MAKAQNKIDPKTIGIIAAVILVVALAVWQGTRALSPSATDVTYTPRVKPPPESARPPGFESAPGVRVPESDEKTGGG